MRRLASLAFALVAGTAGWTSAHADVWGYIDARGVAHFASEKVDERYELFYRGGQSFDTTDGVPDTSTPRPVQVPTRSASRLLAFFEVSPSYKQVKHHLREASQAWDLDYELLQALIATESGFNAAAVSPKGAVGLMQVMPATAQRWGVTADARVSVARKLADPRTNIRIGTRHLRHLMDLYGGNLELVLAAYNAGEGAVQRAGQRIPDFRETQDYVRTVMQLYALLKPPATKSARLPGRVRVEMSAGPADGAVRLQAPPGGAAGRGNLPPPLVGRPGPVAAESRAESN